MTHEHKPKSAEFRTQEESIASLAFHLHEATCDVCWSIATITAEKHILEAEARGAAEQRRKDAEASKARLFSNREQAAADRTPQREDVRQWQADQKEFFLSSVVEVVTEYAEWRDKKDAEGREPVAWIYDAIGAKGHKRVTLPSIARPTDTPYRVENIRPLYTRPANVAALISEAVAAERERCAKIIENHCEAIGGPNGRELGPRSEGDRAALCYAVAIREGGGNV